MAAMGARVGEACGVNQPMSEGMATLGVLPMEDGTSTVASEPEQITGWESTCMCVTSD